MKRCFLKFLSIIVLSMTSYGTQAHHSVSAKYDQASNLSFQVRVSAFEFVYPHPYLRASTVDNPERILDIEMDNLRELAQLEINADTFVPGDQLLITVHTSPYDANAFYLIALEHPRLGFRYEANLRHLIRL